MENIDLFDKYIRDEMSEIEKQDFDNRLIADSDFAEEFRSYQLLVTGLKFSNQEDIFKQMDDLEEGLRRKNKVRMISLIGSVAAIFIGVIFFLNPFMIINKLNFILLCGFFIQILGFQV